MMMIKILVLTVCPAILLPLAFAQTAASPRITAIEAKNHNGETVTVCGKVVDTKIPKYGLAGHGKPVTFDLDQPEPTPVFYFVAFGAQPGGPDEVVAAYKDKRVCVTGKINTPPSGGAPFIMAADRAQIKTQDDK